MRPTFLAMMLTLALVLAAAADVGDSIWGNRYPSPTGGQITSISWGLDKYLATSLDGTLLQSVDDGHTWTPCASPSEGDYVLSQFTDQYYILTDVNEDLLASENGSCEDLTQWMVFEESNAFRQTTDTQISPRPVPDGWTGGFVSVSDYKAYYSTSGAWGTFQEIPMDYTTYRAWGVTWSSAQTTWILKLAKSPDGTHTPSTVYDLYTASVASASTFSSPTQIPFVSLEDAGISYCTVSGEFVSASQGGIITSSDGFTWTVKTPTPDNAFQFGSLVCWENRCVGIGEDTNLYDSNDCGGSFARVNLKNPIPLQRNFPVVSDAGTFLVGSYHGSIFRSEVSGVWAWVGAVASDFSFCDEAVFTGEAFVIGCQNYVLLSDDAVQWSSESYILNGDLNLQLYSLTVGDDTLAAMAGSNQVFLSSNGARWSQSAHITYHSGDLFSISSLVYEQGLYVGVGYDTWTASKGNYYFPSVITSHDGYTWSIYCTNTLLFSVAYSSSAKKWFGAGRNGVYSSTNMYDWTRVASSQGDCSAVQVSNGSGYVFAMCKNGDDTIIVISQDNGQQWTVLSSPCETRVAQPAQMANPICNGLQYLPSVGGFVVFSQSPTGLVYFSTDGANWSQIASPYSARILDMVEGNDLLLTLTRTTVFSGPSSPLPSYGSVPSVKYGGSTQSGNSQVSSYKPGLLAVIPNSGSADSPGQESSDGLAGGGIAGITIACVVVVIGLIVLLVVAFAVHHQRAKRLNRESEERRLLKNENDLL